MQVILTPEAQKHYVRLPNNAKAKIKKKLQLLETNPLSGKKLSGTFTDLRSLKAWPYRIIYYMGKKENELFVTAILHRQGAYQ